MNTIIKSWNKLPVVCLIALLGTSLVSAAQATEAEKVIAQSSEPLFMLSPASSTELEPGSTLSGNYLAARFAQRQQDWAAAQHYMNAVVAYDENNSRLSERAFLLSLGAGEYAAARRLAEKIVEDPQGAIEPALIFMANDALARGEFQLAYDYIGRLPEDGFGQYTKPLISAWALVGMGKRDEGIAHLLAHSAETDPTYNLHVGLMYDLEGNTEQASKYFTIAMQDNLSLHSALLLANFFERSGDTATAHRLYDGLGDLYARMGDNGDAKSAAKEGVRIRTPADGAGVAMYELATMLFERRSYDSAQIYARLVQIMTPDSEFGALMVGDIASINEHYPEAVAAYNGIDKKSPLYLLSRMRVADIYENAGHPAEAVKLLRELASLPQARIQALTAIGDMHRRREEFGEAVAAYDEALDGVDQPAASHWAIVYARGMSLERANEWERAEKDLLLALTFQPDNPMILNYIGYTWVDKNVNLEKALEYIRRAVALRPDDGYILDSYGWAFYRLGDMGQAVYWLEKSVAQVPDDSTILDHLADAYWQTGRHAEARFKWQRARELSKDSDFRSVVERKIQRGIESTATALVHKDTSL